MTAAEELLQRIHSFQLQALHKMGSVRVVDRALGEGLMAEFSRLSLMVDEDLSISLQNHHGKILEANEVLEQDIKKLLCPFLAATHQRELEARLACFRRMASMNLLLPLALLDCAREDLKKFLDQCLDVLRSQEESQTLIGALVERLSNLQGHVWKVLESSKLSELAIGLRVIAGLVGTQSSVVNYYSGVLEGVAGWLGLAPPGAEGPPCSIREGVNRRYAASLAMFLKAEAKGTKPLPASKKAKWVLEGGFHLGYEADFESHRTSEIHPIFLGPVLPGLVAEMDKLCLCEPAKPPSLRQPLTGDKLWVALHHSSYSEGRDLSDKLTQIVNEYLNPLPLDQAPRVPGSSGVPAATSALTTGTGQAAPPAPPVSQGPSSIQNNLTSHLGTGACPNAALSASIRATSAPTGGLGASMTPPSSSTAGTSNIPPTLTGPRPKYSFARTSTPLKSATPSPAVTVGGFKQPSHMPHPNKAMCRMNRRGPINFMSTRRVSVDAGGYWWERTALHHNC